LHQIAEAFFSSDRKEKKPLVERCDMRGQNEIQKLPAERRMPANNNTKPKLTKNRKWQRSNSFFLSQLQMFDDTSVKKRDAGMVVSQLSAKDCARQLWTGCLGCAVSTLGRVREMAR
jgi:hypothetical protein